MSDKNISAMINSKDTPVYSGVIRYFPLAMAAISRVSVAGDRKHNPGNDGPPMWSRGKSTRHDDAIMSHTIKALFEEMDEELGEPHVALRAWRALAALEEYEERKLKKEGDDNA